MRSPRARTASAVLLVGGMLAYAGVAGAAGTAADATVTVAGDATEGQWDKGVDGPVEIATGEKVTWSFVGGGHNVESKAGDPGDGAAKDDRWESYAYPPGEFQVAPKGSSGSFTFYKSGTYNFVCVFHANMSGTIVVTGEDLEIPVETPTPTATATPTATPTPSGNTPPVDDHTTTPPPSPAADTTKPALSGVKLRGRRRAARVTFTLSENATVTLKVRKRGARKVLRTVRLQARAGTRTVVVRSSKLRKGRYTVTLTARDAMGNTSSAARAALRIRK